MHPATDITLTTNCGRLITVTVEVRNARDDEAGAKLAAHLVNHAPGALLDAIGAASTAAGLTSFIAHARTYEVPDDSDDYTEPTHHFTRPPR
jgi:hypothetical protein